MKFTKTKSRITKAFTLVELLVVMAIIAVLVSLTVAAVSSARESSRKTGCMNNLRQIGISLQSYHDANRRFPGLGYLGASLANPDGGFDLISPFPALLPHLGETGIYDGIVFEKGPSDGNFFTNTFGFNATAKKTVIGRLLCPSDSERFDFRANSNYAFSTGASASGPHDGAFAVYRCFSANEISDGLSQTAAVSEIKRGGGVPGKYSPGFDFWFSENDQTSYRGTTADQMLALCEASRDNRDIYVFRGYSWFNGGYENTWYNHVPSPNATEADCSIHTNGPVPTYDAGSFASRSSHSGGVHSAMMDGSVHWISSAVDLGIWRALGTRAGAEVVGAF